MNPFEQHSGIRINGNFFSRAELISLNTNEAGIKANLAAALEFSKTLLSGIDTIKVKTSGSTGAPKEYQFSKKALAVSATATNRFFDLGEGSTAVLPLPMKYIAGKMMVARALVGGYNLIVLEATSNPDLSGLKADFMPVTPFQMHNLLSKQSNALENIKTFLIGGGEPTKDLITSVNRAGVRAFASFGMTETLSHFALADLNTANEFPLYIPVDGAEIKVDKDQKLLVNWPGITTGWLNTNDLVQLDKNGFRWLGRSDNLINSGGIKIIPERIESLLKERLAADFFVAGIKHETLGEELVLFTESALDADLEEFEWEFKYQKPKRVEVFSPFERTVSGKIKRQATIEAWLGSTQ